MDKEDRKNIARAMSLFFQMGITVFVCVALGLLIGIGLDRWLNTAPLFILIFTILGIASGIKILIDLAKKI